MQWRGVHHLWKHRLDSHASTITRLRNGQLIGEKKILFLCRSLFNSSCRNVIRYTVAMACAEGQAIVHQGLPVRGIVAGNCCCPLVPWDGE